MSRICDENRLKRKTFGVPLKITFIQLVIPFKTYLLVEKLKIIVENCNINDAIKLPPYLQQYNPVTSTRIKLIYLISLLLYN